MRRSKPMYNLYKTKSRKTGETHKKWRYKFLDYKGKWKHGTGCTDKKETERIALQFAIEADEIRRGVREAPTVADRECLRPIEEHIADYIAWGKTQGGYKGWPWSSGHLYKVQGCLKWWQNALHFKHLSDITLVDVEKQLQLKKKEGVTGKTLFHYAAVLNALIEWCITRKYLKSNPLKGMGKIDASVKNHRRSMTWEEIAKLLTTSPVNRSLIYETALVTGYRANELASLSVGSFDFKDQSFQLHAESAKDRRDHRANIPTSLAQRLEEHCKGRMPNDKLFPRFPLNNLYRTFTRDLEKAGIQKQAFGGKLDFHALRTTHINLGIRLGFDVKTVQDLARHKTPNLTMNVYARSDKERNRNAVETLGKAIYQTIEDTQGHNFSRIRVEPQEMKMAAGAELLGGT